MKKVLISVSVLALLLMLTACGKDEKNNTTATATPTATVAATPTTAPSATPTAMPSPTMAIPQDTIMTYEQYTAAELDTPVWVEAYVMDTQSWWDNKITIYAADKDGAYYIYNATCSEEDSKLLTPGKKIQVKGYKSEWSGEIEITEGKITFPEGADEFLAQPTDVTDKIGTDDLKNYMNRRVVIKGVKIAAQEDGAAFQYKNAEEKTDDLYFKGTVGDKEISFCVEFYLRGKDTDVYKAVEALKVGDIVDVECYLYWYNDPNPHVIGVTAAQ